MKIKMLCVIMLLCAVIGTSALMPVSAVPVEENKPVSSSQAVEARFLNMLNHNLVYGDTFLNIDDMVNESIPMLLSLRDSADEDFIAEGYVKDFIYSMYGVEIVDMSELNPEMPQKEGYIYIVPRGYSEYLHSGASVRENADGTYTVTTDVTVYPHDGGEYTCKAVSLFVKNGASQFGYNLISSNIIESSTEI